eukprot:1773894-Pleurochrysis_carterae.AAC.1
METRVRPCPKCEGTGRGFPCYRKSAGFCAEQEDLATAVLIVRFKCLARCARWLGMSIIPSRNRRPWEAGLCQTRDRPGQTARANADEATLRYGAKRAHM